VYAGFGSLYIAMFLGTAAGLASKYLLDRKYVFYYVPDSSIDDTKKFMSYTLTGVITTCIFWGTETAFDMLSANEDAKYIGAVTGLTVGYVIKYFLDKRYVFQTV
jgi:putative flippase GtrA